MTTGTGPIGFIGLGSMGMPMAKNLLTRGFTLRGFDIRPAAMAALSEAGGVPATSPAAALENADVAILMVVSAAQATDFIFLPDPKTLH